MLAGAARPPRTDSAERPSALTPAAGERCRPGSPPDRLDFAEEMPTINSRVPQGSEVGELDRCGMVETRLRGGIRQWSQGGSDRDQDITEMDEVCHGRMQAPMTGGHAPLVHCSTRWFPGVDQGVDQGLIRVDQGGSRVDQVFTSSRGRQKRMGNVGAPHSCVARGGGRTCPFVLIKR